MLRLVVEAAQQASSRNPRLDAAILHPPLFPGLLPCSQRCVAGGAAHVCMGPHGYLSGVLKTPVKHRDRSRTWRTQVGRESSSNSTDCIGKKASARPW